MYTKPVIMRHKYKTQIQNLLLWDKTGTGRLFPVQSGWVYFSMFHGWKAALCIHTCMHVHGACTSYLLTRFTVWTIPNLTPYESNHSHTRSTVTGVDCRHSTLAVSRPVVILYHLQTIINNSYLLHCPIYVCLSACQFRSSTNRRHKH